MVQERTQRFHKFDYSQTDFSETISLRLYEQYNVIVTGRSIVFFDLTFHFGPAFIVQCL